MPVNLPHMIAIFAVMAAAAAANAAPISVFGITIGEPLSIPMCAVKPLGDGELAKYKSNARPSAGACWGHQQEAKIGTPIADGTVSILFNFDETMPPMLWNRMEAQVLGGKVQYLTFNTQGLKTQSVDAATLIGKFGKPSKMDTLELQNGFGAKFEALKVEWRVNPSVTASFAGWSEDRGQGVFSIGTAAGERAFLSPKSAPAPSIPL